MITLKQRDGHVVIVVNTSYLCCQCFKKQSDVFFR